MSPVIDLRVGDVLASLAELKDGSVDCVVTSPPYWGLRDYGTGEWDGGDADCDHLAHVGGPSRMSESFRATENPDRKVKQFAGSCGKCGATRTDQQLGLEASPRDYVERLVVIFREVHRVLADHGTVWLNLGDSYANDTKWGGKTAGKHAAGLHGAGGPGREKRTTGLKSKDLCLIPARVAIALQDDGWYVRSDVIWAKPNPMPESATDRPTKSHEYVYMLTKQPHYYFDQEAVREPAEWARWGDQTNGKHEGSGSAASWISAKTKEELQARSTPTWEERKANGAIRGNLAAEGNVGAGTQRAVHGEGLSHDLGDPARGRNIRTVWTIATQPYAEAHFATYPTDLVEPCVKAGCPERVCVVCGKPSERLIERGESDYARMKARGLDWESMQTAAKADGKGHTSNRVHVGGTRNENGKAFSYTAAARTELGWSECGCAYGLEPDALELVLTPTGSRAGDDPSLTTGRAGMNRPRADDEGTRPITRYEQRSYAAQLKASPQADAMREQAGTAFDHYVRTDTSGARPIPQHLLDAWISEGWLTEVAMPAKVGTNYRSGVVLDPFAGSGTTLLVARRLGRSSIGIELNPDYADLARRRLKNWWRDAGRVRDDQIDGQLALEIQPARVEAQQV